MYEKHERYLVHSVLTANRFGEHKCLGNSKNIYRYCPLYHLRLALIDQDAPFRQALIANPRALLERDYADC